jgi:hypothetical protein
MGACSPSIRKDEMYIEFRAFVDSASCLDSPDSTVSVDPYLGKVGYKCKNGETTRCAWHQALAYKRSVAFCLDKASNFFGILLALGRHCFSGKL